MEAPCPRAQESVYVRSHVGCWTLTGHGLTKYIQNDANELDTKFGRIKQAWS